MKKHVMAITYKPKIEPVKDGRCTQTIRKGDKVAVGDEILFHGWSGKPYRSKWGWRKRVTVKHIYPILIYEEGIGGRGNGPVINGPVHPWQSMYCDEIAKLDSINPPTGIALGDVLFSLNGAPTEPTLYQIIKW